MKMVFLRLLLFNNPLPANLVLLDMFWAQGTGVWWLTAPFWGIRLSGARLLLSCLRPAAPRLPLLPKSVLSWCSLALLPGSGCASQKYNMGIVAASSQLTMTRFTRNKQDQCWGITYRIETPSHFLPEYGSSSSWPQSLICQHPERWVEWDSPWYLPKELTQAMCVSRWISM